MPSEGRSGPDPTPAGPAVAFVFTDVEGSTALLRRLGARAYADVITTHEQLLRDAVAANGGHVVDTQGDAVFAAFTLASGAVAAAAAAQRALASHRWPPGEAVRVRMGVHVGAPEVAGARYLGLDVHMAARICAAAHGGQIVASAAAVAGLAESDRVSLHSLGDHRLKDFDAPHELYQVDWEQDAPSFPPLRTGTAEDGGRFEGREDELATAAAKAVARSARRSERRRVLAVVAAIAAIGALVAGHVLTQPTPVVVRPNSIAVLDAATGRVAGDVPLSSPPTALAAGSGAAWVVSGTTGGTLTRIDGATLTPLASAVSGDERGPTDVGVGFGRVWVVNGLDRSITVERTRGTAPPFGVPLPKNLGTLGIGDSHIAIGATAVWIDNGGAAGVSRITPGGVPQPPTTRLPTGAIATGAGAVWVAGARNYFGGTGRVTELDPATGRPVAVFRVHEVDGLAAGSRYAWVTDATTGTVERLDPVPPPKTGQAPGAGVARGRVGRRIPVGRGVQAVAASGSRLWTANPLTGVVSEIDPTKGRVIWRRPIHGSPTKLVADAGRLWVAVVPRPPAARPGGVRVALGPGDIDAVDPAVANYGAVWQIEYASGLNLVHLADAPGRARARIVPDAAARMPRISNHGRTYTFTIRPGLRFSPPSGQPVTARTFQYALERQLTLDAGSTWPGGFLGKVVVGVRPFLQGTTLGRVRGIRVTHEDTLSITTTRDPGLNLLSLLALPYSSAVPIGWTGPGPGGEVPSAGPYSIRSYVPDDQLILVRNPNYRGPRRGRVGQYTFTETNDPSQQVFTGHAGYTPDGAPPGSTVPARIRRFVDPANAGTLRYLRMNTRTGPFRNVLVRRAVNEVIDRPALAVALGPAAAVATDQYLVPGIAGYPREGAGYPLNGPDVAAANRLLHQARVQLPLHVTLLTSTNATDPTAGARAAIIIGDLKRIGFAVTLHTEPYPTLAATADAPMKYDLEDFNFQFAVPDPAFWLVNPAWSEGPYAARFDHANTLQPLARRARAFSRLDLAVARQFAPLAAYAYATHVDYFAPEIRGQMFQPYFGMDYTRLYESSGG